MDNSNKRLAATCDFGTFLHVLQDQLVDVSNPDTKRNLLSEKHTFEETVGIAWADQLGGKESKQLVETQKQPVHKVKEFQRKSPTPAVVKSSNDAVSRKRFRCTGVMPLLVSPLSVTASLAPDMTSLALYKGLPLKIHCHIQNLTSRRHLELLIFYVILHLF